MPAWFIVFYEKYIAQRDEMLSIINQQKANRNTRLFNPQELSRLSQYGAPERDIELADEDVDPMVLKKQVSVVEGIHYTTFDRITELANHAYRRRYPLPFCFCRNDGFDHH